MKILKLLAIIGMLAVSSSNAYAGGDTATDTAVLNQNVVAALTLTLGSDLTFVQAAQNTSTTDTTRQISVNMTGTTNETVQFQYRTSVTMTHTSWTAADATKEIVVTVVDDGFANSGTGNTVTLTGGTVLGFLNLTRGTIAANDSTGDYSGSLDATITYNSLN